eukprot:INCI17475.1.p1 GENE.INCI17475.1~~INCI17475.1.p1  ORF type:complete len:641 (-),score=113.31 INCI17475.1:2102-4024(-)
MKSDFLRLYETNVATKLIAPELRMLQLIALSVIMVYWVVRLLTLHELFVIEAASGSYTVWLTEPEEFVSSQCEELAESSVVPALGACLYPDLLSDEDLETCTAMALLGAPFIGAAEDCQEFDPLLHAKVSHEEIFVTTNLGVSQFECDASNAATCSRTASNPNYPALRSPALDPNATWTLVAGTGAARVNLFYSFASVSLNAGYMRGVEPRFETVDGEFIEFRDFVQPDAVDHFETYGVVSLTLDELRFLANVSMDDVLFNTTVGEVPHRQMGANLRIDVHATNMLLWNVGENKQVTIRVSRHDRQSGFLHPEVRWDDAAMRSGELIMNYGTRIQAAVGGDFYVFDPGFRVLVIVMATDVMIQLATVIVDIIAMALCTAQFKKRFLRLKYYKAPSYSELTATPRAGGRSPQNLKRILVTPRSVGGADRDDDDDCLGALSRRRAESKEEPSDGAIAIALSASGAAAASATKVAVLERRLLGMQSAMKTAFERLEARMIIHAGGIGPTESASLASASGRTSRRQANRPSAGHRERLRPEPLDWSQAIDSKTDPDSRAEDGSVANQDESASTPRQEQHSVKQRPPGLPSPASSSSGISGSGGGGAEVAPVDSRGHRRIQRLRQHPVKPKAQLRSPRESSRAIL